MGATIWVKTKSQADDDDYTSDDYSCFYRSAEALDEVAQAVGVRPLTDFFDQTEIQFELADEDLPEEWVRENETWHQPADALPSLKAVLQTVKAGKVKGVKESQRAALVEELESVLVLLEDAQREGDEFHFGVIM